ncbi:MAG: hypothetical protein EP330_01830 [Deltaproteobacteria bacterium]|nr:MAG: hypothetical protein EP330_01830 [Deltaproteobacteria bacterium]
MSLVLLALLAARAGDPSEDDWGNDDSIGFPSSTPSSDEDDWGEGDDGWGDDDAIGFPSDSSAPAPPPTRESPIRLGGTVVSTDVMWLQRLKDEPYASSRKSFDPHLRIVEDKLRVEVSLHFEADARYLAEGEDLDDATWEVYAYQAAPRLLFADVEVRPGLVVSAGRQIVSWGEGVVLSPLDVINPADQRDPGLGDPDDFKLPILMGRVDGRIGDHELDAIVVPEAFFGYVPNPTGPYGALDDLLAEANIPPEMLEPYTIRYQHGQRGTDPRNFEVYGRWRYFGRGFDLGLYAASLLDDAGLIVFQDVSDGLGTNENVDIVLDHRRFTLLGHSGTALPHEDLLVRWELTAELDRWFTTYESTPAPTFGEAQASMARGMIGLQYNGLPRTTIDLEATKGLFFERPRGLTFDVDTEIFALRVTHDELRERLEMTVLAMLLGADLLYGGAVRAEVNYEVADGLRAGLGVVLTYPGDERGPLYGLDEHHRAFARARYEF